MADIRINALATTAASTASDDFLAVDGSSQGTRKLNAYSPTFGGNLTVSGATTVKGQISSVTNSTIIVDYVTGSDYGRLLSPNSSGAYTTAIQIVNPLTVGGNLTVSGTGTSSFGGKIQSSAVTATGYNQLYDTTGITTGRGAFAITSTGAGLALGIEASVGGTSFTGSTAYASYFGTTTATPIHFITNAAISATLTSGGNLLIGTTTDSANGKLQLATHTTSAGGIGFGSDTSLYRAGVGAGNIALDGTGPALSLFVSGTQKAYFYANNSNTTAYIGSASAGWKTVIMSANNVDALTLDSSQRCILAGALRLNNAYTAGAPTATGYVTLQDSAGNTYKVLVGT